MITPDAHQPAIYLRLSPPTLSSEMCYAQLVMQGFLDRSKDKLRDLAETSTDNDAAMIEEAEVSEMGLELAQSLRMLTQKQLAERREQISKLEKTKKFLQTTLEKVETENTALEQQLLGDSDSVNDGATAASATTAHGTGAKNNRHTNDVMPLLAAKLGGEPGQMLLINQGLAADAEKNVLEKTHIACEKMEEDRQAATQAATFAKQMELCQRKRAIIQDNLSRELERLRTRIAEQKAELEARNRLAKREEEVKAKFHDVHKRELKLEESLSREPQRFGRQVSISPSMSPSVTTITSPSTKSMA